ncbi:MBL fold metallo-hydrolase [Paenibacillus hemerocallicola]|uniref:MBL fold metallo-hydrolase n=1 Tax=Paenibacillus hemerocallicola TaxID=1172614 RepID=A0A5C4T438_9BACL|nr:MBL fold metallo-hydrolase [Paenibacillus hemerocallicola]TNJ63535.1 MBL fold metallo-hydrolase [Paenibacillus hemerocallicola]
MDQLTFLGTGDSMGVPRMYCECAVCADARTSGHNRRYRSSVMLNTPEGELLIDCGPDWVTQMEMLGKRSLGRALITHPHHDHIAGMPEWFDACRWTKSRGTVFAPDSVFATIRRQYPWLEKRLTYVPNDDGMDFGGWRIRPWEVCHGKNGTSFAYRFEKNGYRWAYCSDAFQLTEQQKKPLHGLNMLVLGTNFYKEDAAIESRSVYDMTEAFDLLLETKPGLVYFTHMSHGVDIGAGYVLPANALLARHGLAVTLGL